VDDITIPDAYLLRPRRVAQRERALICFSHLRWSFVWQRPQHLLSRFAREFDVYVVEEPEFVAADAAVELRVQRHRGVTVLTPVLPAAGEPAWGFNRTTNPAIAELLAEFFAGWGRLRGSADDAVLWYYTPMALGAAPDHFGEAMVVYDVMDELAGFLGAPTALRERERALLDRADLVFTGGPSLFESRKDRHPHVTCFPSGVDAVHFANTRRAEEIDRLPQPVIGFYGVIDERLDFDLIAGLADLRPRWTIALIGPVTKIQEEDLPSRPNIVYLGKRDYADLPSYLACFSAAILPFARNEATQFISPTKTLEYLAAGKPVVSTPIKDVVDLYGSVVEFGETPSEFVAAIERLWSESPALRQLRLAAGLRLVAEHAWDEIAARMRAQIDAALLRRAVPDGSTLLPPFAFDHTVLAEEPVFATTAD